MSIFTNAVEKPITTLMLFVGILVVGIFALIQLPIDQYPQMDPPYLSVMTSYPGANAADIEENVSKILEDQLNSVEDLKEMNSTSYDNLSVVSLEFEWNTNLDEAANDVRDAIDKAMDKLPDNIDRPSLLKFNTSMMPIIMYAVRANESYAGLDRIIDDKIINRLNRIDGIAAVNFVGAPKRVVYIDLDPNKLDAYNLTIEQIGNILKAENQDLPAGSIKMGLMDYQFRVEGEFEESDMMNNVVVSNKNGKTIFMRDIALVRDTIKDIALEHQINRQDGGVIMVTKQSGSNSVAIAKKVRAEMEEIKKELPTDIRLDVLNDSSDFIVRSINNLSNSLQYALIFVVLVVLVFLGRWRATFIIALTIPISLVVAFIYLYVTGESLNVISLSSLSIAIGMVVDDAIVVLENITKHIERGSAPREAAKYGTNEVWLSVIVTTLVTIAVFFPLTLVTGMTGILFKQLGWIICITVTTSTLTALTLTPMLSSQLLRLRDKSKETTSTHRFTYDNTVIRVLDGLDKSYERFIRWALFHKTLIIVIAIAICVGTGYLARFVSTDFMPQNDEGSMSVYVKLQTGQRVEETKRIALEIDSMMRANYPEMLQVNLSYGSEDENAGFASLFNKTGSNMINIRIKLNNINERERSVFDIANDLRDKLRDIPDILVYGVKTSSGSMGENSVDVEVMGYDFESTNRIAAQLKQRMQGIKGADDIQISRDDDKPELQLFLDQQKIAEHGLTTAEVAGAIRNRVYGFKPTKYKESGEEYDVIVRLHENYRNSITEIENMFITNSQGKKIRIKELGEIKEYWSPPNIERKSKQRMVKVSITPARGASMGDIAKAARLEIDQLQDVPQEVSIYIGGSYEDQQESFQSLILLMILSIFLVYIVMASQFESFKMPFIIMLSIPFAFTGVVLALLITNTTLSVVAALGAVMLIGIVTKNGIVLIDFINLMRERGIRLYDAIPMACHSRLRPVLMTALTTILGMVPMALSVGEGSETWKPMGIAVIGGMIFSTIITMVIIPVVYATFDRSGSRNKKKNLSKQYKFMDDFDAKELENINTQVKGN